MEIRGKTALVTGGAVRVGKALSLALAQAGANIAIHYHSSEAEAEETAGEVRDLGVSAEIFHADISDPQQVEQMADAVQQTFTRVDILVNSASLFKLTPLPVKDYADWQKVTRVLIDGAFYCSNAFAPGMQTAGEGAILNIVDLSAFFPWPNFAAHSVGKAGLDALTRQLALEYAPQVRVNALAPGPVLPPEDYSEEKQARAAARTLLKRWGSPADVTQAALFLIQADYITGVTLPVDGGEHVGARKR